MSQTNHLKRRNGVWYYRRRVPEALQAKLGTKEIHVSLGTSDLKEAKKRRAVEDLRTSIRFETTTKCLPNATAAPATPIPQTAPMSHAEIAGLVHQYVERRAQGWQHRYIQDPPENGDQQREMTMNVEIELGILQDRDDPRSCEVIGTEATRVLDGTGISADDPALPYITFAECVRRGLIDLQRRKLAVLDDQGEQLPIRPVEAMAKTTTFGQLADQAIQIAVDDAAANGISAKWIDKQRSNFALLREIIGEATAVRDIDYDTCIKVRSVLARVPAGRTKAYSGLPIEEAITRAATDDRRGLSPVTQDQYLATLRNVLDLAAKKRLIGMNPAEGLKPLKRDIIANSKKRVPFTLAQLKQIFESEFYRAAARNETPYEYDKKGWRFWLPLLSLFMGLRPNETCQMLPTDVKRTEAGTWYVDIVAVGDDDEGETDAKTLKTETSRRRIPIHPEIIAIGFVDYAQRRLRARAPLLFDGIRPDKYGSHSKYVLKRFREQYLPAAITLLARQSFYSLRHSFRDALRRIDAPPDALQALGGWAQGTLVSDDYGDKSNPDYQIRFLSKVCFPGIDFSRLHIVRVTEGEEGLQGLFFDDGIDSSSPR